MLLYACLKAFPQPQGISFAGNRNNEVMLYFLHFQKLSMETLDDVSIEKDFDIHSNHRPPC